MIKIGLTGALGSGKSYVAQQFQKNLGFDIIEIDDVRRELLWNSTFEEAIELRKKLAENFNLSTLSESHWLDREKFTTTIFSSAENLNSYSRIATPYIKRQLIEIIKKDSIIVWAYLIEEDYLEVMDFTILVSASTHAITKRLMKYGHDIKLLEPRRELEPSYESRLAFLKINRIPHALYDNE